MAAAHSVDNLQHSAEDQDFTGGPGIEVPQIPQYVEISQIELADQEALGTNSTVQLRVQEMPSRIERDDHGHRKVHVAAARNSAAISELLLHRKPMEAITMLNEKTDQDGWTSLHISTIQNNADVVSYILGKVSDEEQKREFIRQVDKLGWTSLHWGSMLDNMESVVTTMNSLSVSDQMDMRNNRWSLLHATSFGNAAATMEALMNRFESGKDKWKIITCPTANGRSALHIAVAEGNARAAIMLLDIADADQGRPLTKKDIRNRMAQEYSSQFPLLGEYLELATTFDGPVLHQAAIDNDKVLVSWILNLDPDSHMDQLSRKNVEGLTVVQSACRVNSDEVITEISKTIKEENFMKCLMEFSDNGETALHLAVIANNPATVHTILRSVKQNHGRKQIMETVNRSGETALERAQKLEYPVVMTVLENYELITSENFLQLFSHFENSLFALQLREQAVRSRNEITNTHEEEDLGYERDVNYAATVCLLQENPDLTHAESLIEKAVKIDEDNINTWCNKGIFLLKRESIYDEIEKVAFKLLDLVVEPSRIPMLRAKIDYAYRMVKRYKTEEVQEESYQLFDKIQREVSLYSDSKMREYCSHLYLKMLIRYINSDVRNSRPDFWFKERMSAAIEQLLILQKSQSEDHQGHMWLELAELQLSTKVRKFIIQEHLATFDRELCAKEVKLDLGIKSCLHKAMELIPKVHSNKKFQPRIAKSCLYFSYHFSYQCGVKDKRHWLTTALNISEKWIAENHWEMMCASNSAQALVQLWSLDYYPANEQHVEDKYLNYQSRKGNNAADYGKYLQNSYYGPALSGSKCSREYLERAREHMKQIVTLCADGYQKHGIKYARVKCLLGDPQEEILPIFHQATEMSTPGKRRARAFENLGYYYGILKVYNEAEKYFRKAYKECNGDTWKPQMARNGQAILRRPYHQRNF